MTILYVIRNLSLLYYFPPIQLHEKNTRSPKSVVLCKGWVDAR